MRFGRGRCHRRMEHQACRCFATARYLKASPETYVRRALKVRPLRDPALSRLETDVLLMRWRDLGDLHARDELVGRYTALARRLAARYRGPNEPFEDLVQVALLGLLMAIDRFDPERGVAFPAFAIPTILGELKKYFRRTGWSVHVPRGAQEMALRVDNVSRQIAARSGRQPRIQEVAEYLEVSADDVVAGLEAGTAHYAQSLDALVAGSRSDERRSLMDAVGIIDRRYEVCELAASLRSELRRLPRLERRALALSLERGIKQSEIAAEMGCSQMQVSRLLRRATARLAEIMERPDHRS